MPKLVKDAYKFLYHYTTASGLEGIVRSGCLWATNIEYLNDYEERVGYFNKRFPKLFDEGTEAAAKARNMVSFLRDMAIQDPVYLSERAKMLDVYRNAQLKFHVPYVASFSHPPSPDADNGQLSQWRAYGRDGGYALVFDTKALDEWLIEEGKAFNYQSFNYGDVEYFDQEDGSARHEETVVFENEVRAAIREAFLNPGPAMGEELYAPLTYLSCAHKHRGFKEEVEVRVIAIPANDDVFAASLAAGDSRPAKPVHFRNAKGTLVPYIELFAGLKVTGSPTLPIVKVIIGPHPDRQLRKSAVQALLARHDVPAEVVVSEIPYVGR